MSKKSRRRNKRILGALALLGTGLALANRGKGTEMSNISVDSGRGGDSSSADARVKANKKTPAKVYQDAIMRGEKGVKYQKPDLKFGQVVKAYCNKKYKDSDLGLFVGSNSGYKKFS